MTKVTNKWRPLPKHITKEFLDAVTELAATGLNKQQISTKLQFDHNRFHRYKEFSEAFKQGRVILAENVAASFKANIKDNYNDRLYIARQLRLFDTSIAIDPIVDVNSARKALAAVSEAYIQGQCSDSMVEQTRKLCQTYVDLETATELERRLAEVEAHIKERDHG